VVDNPRAEVDALSGMLADRQCNVTAQVVSWTVCYVVPGVAFGGGSGGKAPSFKKEQWAGLKYSPQTIVSPSLPEAPLTSIGLRIIISTESAQPEHLRFDSSYE
jgi:hypothetical protein